MLLGEKHEMTFTNKTSPVMDAALSVSTGGREGCWLNGSDLKNNVPPDHLPLLICSSKSSVPFKGSPARTCYNALHLIF